MKKLFTLLIAVAMFGFLGNAQNLTIDATNDTIDVSTTWAYDTVFLDINLMVLETAELTIEPGVVVAFNDNYLFEIEGKLLAEGEIGDTIVFTATDTTGYYNHSHTGWQGVGFNEPTTTDTSSFYMCKFMYAKPNSDSYAAIYMDDFSNVIINNCFFYYNYTTSEASAIQITDASSPTITNCEFMYNESNYSAIQVGHNDGGANPLIANNLFKYNIGNDEGSCIKISGYGGARVINNIFAENHASNHGGAIQVSGYCHPSIIGNLIINNTCDGTGGAIHVKYYSGATILNNTIIGNYAMSDGGAVAISDYSTGVTFKNNIIGGNYCDGDGQQIYIYSNSGVIFYNNDIEGGLDNIYGNEYVNTYIDNIDEDPYFVDPVSGDFHLICGSPCVNTGSPDYYLPEFDMDGNARQIGEAVDMGAFELLTEAIITSNPSNATVHQNEDATFSVVAEFASAYLWQVSSDYGDTWVDIVEDEVYSTVDTETLTLTTIPLTFNGYAYRCIITGPCTDVASEPGFLFVNYMASVEDINSQLLISPNPAKDYINIQVQNTQNTSIQIVDISGKLIYSSQIISNNHKINTTKFAKGLYFVKLNSNDEIYTKKLVIN